VPVEFLSDAEAAEYGRFDGAPSRVELDRVFFLDDADRELIRQAPRRAESAWVRAAADDGPVAGHISARSD
jgi:hypothetical protein